MAYATLTVVVRVDGPIDPDDLPSALSKLVADDRVQFVFACAEEGVTAEAYRAGADPTSWPDSEGEV